MDHETLYFEKIPLTAMRIKGRLLLSHLLNPIKILPSEEGYPRDWRGIAHLAGIENSSIGSAIANSHDEMAKVLQLWYIESKSSATFDNLFKFLGIIDRWDVLSDIIEILNEDAKFHLSMKQQPDVNTITSKEQPNIEENVITKDDVLRAQVGLPPQFYDAFVLFADEDIDFATEVIEKMENYGFKLCVRERDIVGGISFEHEAILRLISDRCNRLIVIISPAFLKSRANSFFVNFAQALGIEQGRRKIIPCLYERCILPPALNFTFLLNYQRSGKFWNFWEKLKDSLQYTPTEIKLKNSLLHENVTNITVPSLQINENEILQQQSISKDFNNDMHKLPLSERNTKNAYNSFKKEKNFASSSSSSLETLNENAYKPESSRLKSKNEYQLPELNNFRTQSLMNLDKLQKQQNTYNNSKFDNCDIKTKSNTNISQLLSVQQGRNKESKWYNKYLSVSSIFENFPIKKKHKKHSSKKKLPAINS